MIAPSVTDNVKSNVPPAVVAAFNAAKSSTTVTDAVKSLIVPSAAFNIACASAFAKISAAVNPAASAFSITKSNPDT